MNLGWITAGVVGGLLGAWLLVRQLKRGIQAESEAKALKAQAETAIR